MDMIGQYLRTGERGYRREPPNTPTAPEDPGSPGRDAPQDLQVTPQADMVTSQRKQPLNGH